MVLHEQPEALALHLRGVVVDEEVLGLDGAPQLRDDVLPVEGDPIPSAVATA